MFKILPMHRSKIGRIVYFGSYIIMFNKPFIRSININIVQNNIKLYYGM